MVARGAKRVTKIIPPSETESGTNCTNCATIYRSKKDGPVMRINARLLISDGKQLKRWMHFSSRFAIVSHPVNFRGEREGGQHVRDAAKEDLILFEADNYCKMGEWRGSKMIIAFTDLPSDISTCIKKSK